MTPVVVWLGFTVATVLICVARPTMGRWLVGLFFLLMAIGVNVSLAISDPGRFREFADGALIPVYRDVAVRAVEVNPRLFGLTVAAFEIVMAIFILGRERLVPIGLSGGIVFLLAITPLGVEQLPNMVLAAGMAFLLSKYIDRPMPRRRIASRREPVPPMSGGRRLPSPRKRFQFRLH